MTLSMFPLYGSRARACPSSRYRERLAMQVLEEAEGQVFNLHGSLKAKTTIKSRLRL